MLVLIEQSKQLRLEDLEEGNVFDEDELIIENEIDRIRTISKWQIDGEKIRVNYYSLRMDEDRIKVNYEGHTDIFQENFDYLSYFNKLKEKGLIK